MYFAQSLHILIKPYLKRKKIYYHRIMSDNNILHIIPDYLNTSLYDLLILSLECVGFENIVYVPTKGGIKNRSYKVDCLQKEFSLLDRVLYFRKQHCIYKDLIYKYHVSDIKIIHAHNLFSAGYAAMRMSKEKNIPYVVAVRNTDVNIFFKYMIHLRWLGINILKNASKIVFLSPVYERLVLETYIPYRLKEIIASKTIVIPNGIDKFFLENLYLREKYKFDKAVRLLYVGGIVKNKNITTTISACLDLKAKGYQVVFSVVGKIIETEIMGIIKQYGFIHYYPHCDRQEILKHMRASDIFVMPSVTETFGLVYVEAMTQGMPVIYSKGQGIDGYFSQGEVGYSVDCFDYESIAQRILEIYGDYDNISQRCIERVNKFDWNRIALVYKELVYKMC